MCVDYPVLPYRIHFHPMPGTIDKLHQETTLFANQMSTSPKFFIRPYPRDFSGKFISNLKNNAPNARLYSRKIGVSLLYSKSRIVIHNYLGTSYIETLSLNIPTIVFYDSDTYEFNDKANPYIQKLIGVGILHKSALGAAKFLKKLDDEIEEWWTLPEVQAAKNGFINKYGNFSKEWRNEWEKHFKKFMHVSMKKSD